MPRRSYLDLVEGAQDKEGVIPDIFQTASDIVRERFFVDISCFRWYNQNGNGVRI